MLVLTRNTNDSVTIGDDIEVTVLGISGNTVKLGFCAPNNVLVNRSEVYVRIKRENRNGVVAST